MGDAFVFRQRVRLCIPVKKFFPSCPWIHHGVLFHPMRPMLSFDGREPHSIFLIFSLSCLEICAYHLKFQGNSIGRVYLDIDSYFFYLLIFILGFFCKFFFCFFNCILQSRFFIFLNSVLTLFFLYFFLPFFVKFQLFLILSFNKKN